MKVQFKVGPKVIVEAEGDSPKQVFERLASLAEVFACADKCGACGSPEVVPRVRHAQGYDFYELACQACSARLSFGQTKEGEGLFPKRKDEQANPKGKDGWEVWQGQTPARGSAGRAHPKAHRPDSEEEIPY